MKISSKEKNLLAVVGIVALTAGYYQFIYVPQKDNVKAAEDKYNAVQTDFDTKQNAIASINGNKDAILKLKTSIDSVSNFIYPEIWQEKITKEVSAVKKKTGLKGSLSFTEPTYMPISAYFQARQAQGETQKTLDDLMKDYNGVALGDNNATTDEKKEEIKDKLNESKELGEKQKEEAKKEPTAEEQKFAVKQMKVTMNFSGTHAQLLNFIKEFDSYERLIAIPDINIAASGTGSTEVTGTLNLEFYAVPKVGDEDLEYFDWDGSSVSGKENPFNDLYTSNPTVNSEAGSALMINLRPAASDMASIMVGRTGDTNKTSYLEAGGNKKEAIEVEFTSAGGKYFVSYTLAGKKYPASGVEEIKQTGKLITMDINSAPRLNEQDNVAAQVIVKNKTDKKVAVSIKNDDSAKPRITMITEGDVQYTNVQ
ncbi:MAG: hypothetical protein ACRDD2_03875 [Sarcina sp.]